MNKVLIVDDSEEFIFLISSLLKFQKLEVVVDTNPKSALEKIESDKMSLIITDYLMEQMSGLDLAEEVRRSKLNANVPIILLTAKKLDQEEIVQCSNLKLVYVMKPVMPNDLYRKVKDCLERK